MPGISLRVVDGALGCAARLFGGVRRLVAVDFFLVVFGFGFAAGIFFISCPSCCGNAEVLIASMSANTKIVRHDWRHSLSQFMNSPVKFAVREPKL